MKNLPAMIPGLRRSPGEGMATHPSILAWRIAWTKEPGGLVHGVTKSGHDLVTDTFNPVLETLLRNYNNQPYIFFFSCVCVCVCMYLPIFQEVKTLSSKMIKYFKLCRIFDLGDNNLT